MKYSIVATTITLLVISSALCQAQVKRYKIKSGKVVYTTQSSGGMMGTTINSTGSESLYFKDWGKTELKEGKSTETTISKMFGRTNKETTESHTMNKLENGISYTVNFSEETIYKSKDIAMEMMAANSNDTNASDIGEQMLESMGGEKVGNEKLLGYNCEVWSIPGGKQWIYQGVMLKLEMTLMGVSSTTIAQSADFNISLADAKFSLPNYPIKELEGTPSTEAMFGQMDKEDQDVLNEDIKKMQEMSKLSYPEWKKLVQSADAETRNMSDQELRAIYDMMQTMVKNTK